MANVGKPMMNGTSREGAATTRMHRNRTSPRWHPAFRTRPFSVIQLRIRNGSSCRGFRTTAPITGVSTGTGAVVRKPSGKEPAGCWPQRCRGRYGDFDTAAEDAAADEVAGGMIAERHGGSDGARLAGQQGSEADRRLAGCWLGRALSRPVLDQRDRSGQQCRMTLRELMRC